MPEPITAPIPSDVKLSQPSDFLSCLSGFSESEISRSIFLVRKSCAPNRHLPGRKREESTLCNSSTQHLTSRRSRPEALSNHLVVHLDASSGLNPEALWTVGGHKPKKRRHSLAFLNCPCLRPSVVILCLCLFVTPAANSHTAQSISSPRNPENSPSASAPRPRPPLQ